MRPDVARSFGVGQVVEVSYGTDPATMQTVWKPAVVVGFSPGRSVVKVRHFQLIAVNGKRYWVRPRSSSSSRMPVYAIEARRDIRALPECIS